jgi:hypothetical protein
MAARYYQLVVDQRFTSNLFCSLESLQGYVFVLHILGRHELAQQSLDLLEQLFGEQISATPEPVMALNAWLKLQHGDPSRCAPLGRIIYRSGRRAGDRLVSYPPYL